MAAAIPVAASVAGSIISSKASSKAAKAQQAGTDAATNAQLQMYNTSRDDLAPYRNTGSSAENQLAYLMGLAPYNSDNNNLKSGEKVTGTANNGMLGTSTTGYQSTNGTYSPSASASHGNDSSMYGGAADNSTNFINGSYGSTGDYVFQPGSGKDGGRYVLSGSHSDNPGAYGSLTPQQYANQKAYEGTIAQKTASSATAPDLTSTNNGYGNTVNPNTGGYGSLTHAFGLADYQADPGYQFRLDQGNKAIDNAQAARGGLYSGAALKEADAYNSGQASQEFGNAYDRFNTNQNNLYNRLAGIANSGYGAVNTGVQSNTATGNSLGQIAVTNGQNQANKDIAQGNAFSQILGGGGSSFGGLFSGGNSGTSLINNVSNAGWNF